MKMEAICCGKMEERAPSFRRVGRSNSTLVASELAASEAARVVAYSRLSQSMRVYDDEQPSCRYDKRRKNKALAFLKKVFSCKNTGGAAAMTAEKAAEQKKQQSSWFPDPHRRWPVQGWGKGMEIEGKAAEVLVEQKKRRQPTILPNPYRRWPVQGW